MKLLDHMVIVCLDFDKLPNYFLQYLYNFISPLAMYQGPDFSTSLPTLVIFPFFIIVILGDVKSYLIVVWICISLND